MATVDEYVSMAEAAQQDGSHVAVLTYYRDAIEGTEYSQSAAPILLAAMQYAQKLMKQGDRRAMMDWGTRVLEAVKPNADLEATINQEISKLKAGGKENATA